MIHDLPLPQTQIQDLSVIRLGKKKEKKKNLTVAFTPLARIPHLPFSS